jgi:hypothetical protein
MTLPSLLSARWTYTVSVRLSLRPIVQPFWSSRSAMSTKSARLQGTVREFLLEPTNQPWGNRSMLLRDPDGLDQRLPSNA